MPEATTKPAAETLHAKKFILVAEDDRFYANVYKVKLTKEGFDVAVVGNGDYVLAMAKKKKPDLILLDLIMPVKDGFTTLKELKADANLKSIKVVILSNLSQAEDKTKAKQLGAEEFVTKANVSIQEMVEMVKKYVN